MIPLKRGVVGNQFTRYIGNKEILVGLKEQWELNDPTVDHRYLASFLEINLGITVNQLQKLNGKKLPPTGEYEFRIICKQLDVPPMMPICPILMGLEYQGVEYIGEIPENVFNWFVYLFGRYETIKVSSPEDIRNYFQRQNQPAIESNAEEDSPEPETPKDMTLAQILRFISES